MPMFRQRAMPSPTPAPPRWEVDLAFHLRRLTAPKPGAASDVPGFPMPVYLAGATVRMQYAFAPTIGAAVNVTLLSYVDTCAIGINMDAAAIPHAEVFYDCLVAGFDDVVALAN